MRIGRAIIIPAAFALGVAGSLLSGAALTGAAGHPAAVHVQAAASKAKPGVYYHA